MWLAAGACVALYDYRSIRIRECEERLGPQMFRSNPCACHVGVLGVGSGYGDRRSDLTYFDDVFLTWSWSVNWTPWLFYTNFTFQIQTSQMFKNELPTHHHHHVRKGGLGVLLFLNPPGEVGPPISSSVVVCSLSVWSVMQCLSW